MRLCLLAGGVCAVRSEDVAPPVEALGGASAALRAGTGVNAVPAAADVGDVGDVGENRTLCAYVRQADLMSAGRRPGRPYARKPGPRATLCSKKTENRKPKTEKRETEKPPGARSPGPSPSPSSQLARSQEALLRAKQAADARSGRPVASGCGRSALWLWPAVACSSRPSKGGGAGAALGNVHSSSPAVAAGHAESSYLLLHLRRSASAVASC